MIPAAQILVPGITGYGPADQLPGTVAAEFKAACYGAAREAHGTLLGVEPANASSSLNYHRAEFEGLYRPLSALCSPLLPLIAFVDGHGAQGWSFVDAPEIAEVLSTYGYTLYMAREMASPVGPAELALLTAAECKMVGHFKPKQIGDLLFNCWD